MQRGALLGVCIFLFAKSSALLNVGSGLRSPIRSAMPVRRASLSSVLRPGQWRGGKQLRKDAGSRLQPVRNVVLEPTETEEDGTDTPDDLIWQAPEQWQERFNNGERRRGKQQLLTLDGSILRAVTLVLEERGNGPDEHEHSDVIPRGGSNVDRNTSTKEPIHAVEKHESRPPFVHLFAPELIQAYGHDQAD